MSNEILPGTQTLNNLREIMSHIDLGPTGSVQMMFAKLQLAQSQICKYEAEQYMEQITSTQDKQEEVAEIIKQARALQQEAKKNGEKAATEMPEDMRNFFLEHDLAWDETENNYTHNASEWDFNIQQLMNYQESLGTKTQTQMVFLQDFISQYNSYLQGANSAIQESSDVLTAIATGR